MRPFLRRLCALAALGRLALLLCAVWGPPAIAQTAAPAPDAHPVIIGQGYDLVSATLHDTRRVNVYLPDGYATSPTRYPVLILLDGGADEDFHHITGLAQINAAYGQGQPLIVVGVAGVDRRHDLTAPPASPADRARLPTAGGSAAYRRFLVDELQPWVRARYRTCGRTALIGESLAGLFVVETLLTAPRSFDDYIAVSPSLGWNGGALARSAAADLARGGFAGRRAWIGFEEPAPPAAAAARDRALQDRLAGALTAAHGGLEVTTRRLPDGHAGVYHPAAMAALRELYGAPAKGGAAVCAG